VSCRSIHCTEDRLLAADTSWVGERHEVNTGARVGVTTSDAQRMKDLERENKELRRANEILKLAYGVESICKALQIASSGYWLKPNSSHETRGNSKTVSP
jgi:hypothetical protein